ncbi:uncharacterized protein LOC133287507 [Gastrolobium bilobum]|uniref:uncharacterized protein LOC133287507 n=1 Tax=Gastrolobium bilobum TaxID=150636 RepID=UPI002AB09B8B|nr:uncharacterized protein LOC133287507 [Gastrolobium bilobum]
MAPETRSRPMEDRWENTQAEIDVLKEHMNKRFQEITCKLDAIFDNYRDKQSSPSGSTNQPHASKDHAAAKNLRLKVSRYDGLVDPQGWIYKINQFFDFYDMEEEQRLKIAPFYFEGKALKWYQWFHKNSTIDSWPKFLQSLQIRFGPSKMEDYQGQLTKLLQTGTVLEYQEQFEHLSNQVDGLSESFLVSCFISGLKKDIQHDVSAFRPSSLSHAMSLAKIHESKLLLKTNPPKLHSSYPPLLPTLQSRFHQTTNTTKPFVPNTTPTQNQPLTHKLTQSQMQERRDKNLCFYCGEKYFKGHKCKAFVHLLIIPDEENVDCGTLSTHEYIEDPPPLHMEPIEMDTPQISMHALSGFVVPQTLRFNGFIGKSEIVLLVDGGSTHNFVQPRVVSDLQLPILNDKQFDVMVGNGQILKCEGFCSAVPVQVQQHVFLVDCYVLSIQGADLVLGVQWLQLLGPIVLDYQKLSMEFSWEGESIRLQGDKHTTSISFNQFKKIKQQGQVASLFQLSVIDMNTTTTVPAVHTEVTILINEFDTLFQEPTELPPHRQLDHQIHLQPNSAPVNVRPYRYPHFQKGEIEKQVKMMLDSGFIRTSTSPFSSPVLLVKKKDGSWRFCIDFRALNSITIRDRFPIPTADELMDELGGSTIFSKLDLRAGYHQIRMSPDDVHKTAFRTHQGHYEFLVMPFGLTNAPSTFQATMNIILQPCLRKFVAVFLDDILIYSSSMKDHLQHLRVVLSILKAHQFYIKKSKCSGSQQV